MRVNRYAESLSDIAIAQNALEQSLLVNAVVGCRLLCDVYCIPSHNHQAFYLQVYGGTKYTLLYAKTLISDFLGGNNAMYTFADALEANDHAAKKGAIYCGIKHLPSDDGTISRLLSCLPSEEECCNEHGIVLDGVHTVIRNHQYNPPVVLEYNDSRQIERNKVTQEQKDFMNDLYLRIEEIIGNLIAVSNG